MHKRLFSSGYHNNPSQKEKMTISNAPQTIQQLFWLRITGTLWPLYRLKIKQTTATALKEHFNTRHTLIKAGQESYPTHSVFNIQTRESVDCVLWSVQSLSPTQVLSHVCGRVRRRMRQDQTFVVIVGEAGVVAGAAPAGLRSGHGGSHRRDLLGLAQLLDQETFVTALLSEGWHEV